MEVIKCDYMLSETLKLNPEDIIIDFFQKVHD